MTEIRERFLEKFEKFIDTLEQNEKGYLVEMISIEHSRVIKSISEQKRVKDDLWELLLKIK